MHDLRPTTDRVMALVDGVRDDHLDAPTPSDGTTVQMLLQHLLGLSVAFRHAAAKLEGPTTRTPPAPVTEPLPDGWRDTLRRNLSGLADAWTEPSDAEAEAVLPVVTPSGDEEADEAAREGVFGPALPVPDGARAFQRALCLSGRDPGWTITA